MAGASRVGSGPAPDPNALRRNKATDQAGWSMLPSGGRKGRTPKWPLIEPTERELDLWRTHWRMPQAVAWERLGCEHEVAHYIRLFARVEGGALGAAVEMRQWSDRLGLNPPAMLRNRWRIAADEVTPRRQVVRSVPATSARDRLRTINDEATG